MNGATRLDADSAREHSCISLYVASRIRIIVLCVVRNALEAAGVSVSLDEVKYWLPMARAPSVGAEGTRNAHCRGRGVSRCVAALAVAFAARGGRW